MQLAQMMLSVLAAHAASVSAARLIGIVVGTLIGIAVSSLVFGPIVWLIGRVFKLPRATFLRALAVGAVWTIFVLSLQRIQGQVEAALAGGETASGIVRLSVRLGSMLVAVVAASSTAKRLFETTHSRALAVVGLATILMVALTLGIVFVYAFSISG